MRTVKLRALDAVYCALVLWVRMLQKKRKFLPQWQPQKGGQCNRRMMPSECFASKGYPLDLDLPDEIKYRCAGNMVPMPLIHHKVHCSSGRLFGARRPQAQV